MLDAGVETFMSEVIRSNPGEIEFHQAVTEVVEHVIPFVEANPEYKDARILHRLVEPDRVIMFRVAWENDMGQIQVNKGYRVQFNGAIGPYKGGLRFHPTVNLSILKFLGFEQILKNSLTTLPMGGAKGGSDFDPKGKSDKEVMRFCQAFMTELFRHIGKDTDVPAGDIGVGAREIGYLFGQYKRMRNEFTGSMTGKGLAFGGSTVRPEATGYGAVYFVREMLATRNDDLEGKVCTVSGSGNVAQYTAQRLIRFGAKVVTLSDSNGFVYDPDGLTEEKVDWVIDLKNNRRAPISDFADEFGLAYFPGQRPWQVPCQVAFPSATQNELDGSDARTLVHNGCIAVAEGANMPTTPKGVHVFEENKVLYAPGKAANAGGVAISGLEMQQNSMHMSWTFEEVDTKLQQIMRRIHDQCVEYGSVNRHVSYTKGANIAGFKKVADAMLAYGVM
ncbi:MAG TPA: NADP-specific glutamate dehydrogenase [Rhodothermia bacterium]|nr:NADP-specific glutamate dehydrogenase [Rhodothermia bacterium]